MIKIKKVNFQIKLPTFWHYCLFRDSKTCTVQFVICSYTQSLARVEMCAGVLVDQQKTRMAADPYRGKSPEPEVASYLLMLP